MRSRPQRSRWPASCCSAPVSQDQHLSSVRYAADSTIFTDQPIEEVNLDNADFITNDQLRGVLEQTGASPAEVDAAIELLMDARLDSLQFTLMLLAGLALVPAGGMPDFRKPDLTAEDEEGIASRHALGMR